MILRQEDAWSSILRATSDSIPLNDITLQRPAVIFYKYKAGSYNRGIILGVADDSDILIQIHLDH